MSGSGRFDWAAAIARVNHAREVIERGTEDTAARDRVYRERAERLARPASRVAGPAGANPVLLFRAGPDRYGLPLSSVVEIVAMPGSSPVPGAPPLIRGVTQVRGEIVPVVSLSRHLGAQDGEPGGILVILRSRARSFAIQVDAVEDIVDRSEER